VSFVPSKTRCFRKGLSSLKQLVDSQAREIKPTGLKAGPLQLSTLLPNLPFLAPLGSLYIDSLLRGKRHDAFCRADLAIAIFDKGIPLIPFFSQCVDRGRGNE